MKRKYIIPDMGGHLSLKAQQWEAEHQPEEEGVGQFGQNIRVLEGE